MIFNLGPRSVEMLQAPRYLNLALCLPSVYSRGLKHVARRPHVAGEDILCGPRWFLEIFK